MQLLVVDVDPLESASIAGSFAETIAGSIGGSIAGSIAGSNSGSIARSLAGSISGSIAVSEDRARVVLPRAVIEVHFLHVKSL